MKIRWKHGVIFTLFFFATIAFAIYIAFVMGFVEPLVERAIVRNIEQQTGARVEMKKFRLHPWILRAEIDGLTLHGLESPTAPPLLQVDKINIGIRIISFFGRKYALDELIVQHPQVAVQIDAAGHSNIPKPKRAGNSPWRETLFKLEVGRFELHDGNADFGNRRVPLSMAARNFGFALHYAAAPAGADSYVGSFNFHQVRIAERHDLPFAFDLSGKFTLHRDSFVLDQLACIFPHSELNLRAELPSFARSDWNLRYRGRLSRRRAHDFSRSHHSGRRRRFLGTGALHRRPMDGERLLRRS